VTRLAILGTVGLPPRYGGFETLAARLVEAAAERGLAGRITVWCSAPQAGANRPAEWHGARLRYLPLRANGVQSIPYDALSLWQAARSGHEAALLLGVSGAAALPLIRATSSMRIVTHLDGIEWQRPKWNALARAVLRRSEAMAARWSHHLIADNPAISAHIRDTHGREPAEIAYGHETPPADPAAAPADLPARYALAVARAEPENNLALMLEAFSDPPRALPLVIVANWHASAHGRSLLARHAGRPGLHLRDAEYDPGRLAAIRAGASLYLHGHSAGGTNPSLVEMMGAGIPIAAYDCTFNRATTEGRAAYFDSAEALRALLPRLLDPAEAAANATAMAGIAHRRYRWRDVTDAYFDLLGL
jgi:glycosyltransferase involved in cell wall biosynthesis